LAYVNEGVGGWYVKFIALLVQKFEFKNIAELGNREGLSTLAIFDQLAPNTNFTSIDIDKDLRYCPEEMFQDKRVNFLYGDVCSINILEKIPDGIDFLFSDTIHYAFQVRDEFEIYQHLLADQALVAIDDIYLNDKGNFWEGITFEKWDLSKICHQSGWGLFLFERKQSLSPEERREKMIEEAAKIWERKYLEMLARANSLQARTLIGRGKRLIKKMGPLYRLLCFVNNKFLFIKPNTRPWK